jgi:hypothetical protein
MCLPTFCSTSLNLAGVKWACFGGGFRGAFVEESFVALLFRFVVCTELEAGVTRDDV